MIVYDVTNEESIKNLEAWIQEYENNNPCEFVISIVGNKVSANFKLIDEVDLISSPQIHPRVAKILKKYSLNHYFVSAKTNEGMEDLFYNTVKTADDLGYINNFNMNHRETIIETNSTMSKKKDKKKSCCQ